jgi:hypothetical protein
MKLVHLFIFLRINDISVQFEYGILMSLRWRVLRVELVRSNQE